MEKEDNYFTEKWPKYKKALFVQLILELPAVFALNVCLAYYIKNYVLKL